MTELAARTFLIIFLVLYAALLGVLLYSILWNWLGVAIKNRLSANGFGRLRHFLAVKRRHNLP